MLKQIDATVTLAVETCCNCGTVFAVEATLQRKFQEQGTDFFCPNGHSQHYSESQVDRLKQQLAQEAKKREQLETQSKRYETWYREEREKKEAVGRKLTATRGVVTRIKNRVANGVCPVCNRTFTELWKHMQGQHPNFQKEEAGEE